MHGLLASVRYTVRLLLKSPGFTITAVLILGFGIGANTAIFSLIDAVVLKPPPYPRPERLVKVGYTTKELGDGYVSLLNYLDLRAAQQSFDELAVASEDFLDLSDSAGPQRFNVGFVSASLFTVTGRPFIVGRPFSDEEDSFGGPLVVILTERFWRSHFESDPNAIGKNIMLSGRSFEVIGVCPTQIDDWGIDSPDLYVPVHCVARADDPVFFRDHHFLDCYGRLKPGVTVEQAQRDLDRIQRTLVERYPKINQGWGVHVKPLLDSIVGDTASNLWLLAAAVACLLLIAVANVANLLFCRAMERQKEMVVRRVLGATRLALAGDALLESFTLSLLGAGVGCSVALCLIGLIKEVGLQESLPRVDRIVLDDATVVFFIGITGLVSLLTGWLPAVKAVVAGTASKDASNRSGTTGRERKTVQRVLVIGQVALSCVLLTAATLMLRSFLAAEGRSLGFNPEQLVAAEISLTSRKYDDLALERQFFNTVLEQIRLLPGITEAGMNSALPFDLWDTADPLFLPGTPKPDQAHVPRVDSQSISPGYFRTLQIPLLRGRDFGAEDTAASQPVVIINEALASRYFPNEDPIGKQIIIYALRAVSAFGSGRDGSCTIVGVAGNVLRDSPDGYHAAFDVYFPYNQRPMSINEVLVLRGSTDLAMLTPVIRSIVASADPEVAIGKITTVNRLIGERFTNRKTGMLLVAVFSATALFLSAIGIYGTLAYTVIQRTREVGIRVSLGATSTAILRLILRDGLQIIGIGLILGGIVAQIATHLIQSALYGVSANDPIALSASVMVLALAAFAACLLPAFRAARISPITALRE